jgi:hypothetical protein
VDLRHPIFKPVGLPEFQIGADKGLPQPAVALLKTLLAKEPARRFQNPGRLLEALPAVAGAIQAGRTLPRFGWSFYRQGTSEEAASADEFLDAALRWFEDPDPRLGSGWEKGERLARLIARRRALLVLDGLEPLQNPPGAQEGRLREPSLQALLRELAAFNKGLCVITTRLPVADLADHERRSAPRRELEHLSREAGAQLLRALSVNGPEAKLQSASQEFGGHCLALTLLGSYLSDAHGGTSAFATKPQATWRTTCARAPTPAK